MMNQKAAQEQLRNYQTMGTTLSGKAIDRPPAPTPSLSHIQARLEEANGRFMEKISLLSQMNDRFLGQSGAEANAKMDSGPGVVAQIEYLVMVYEQGIAALAGQLDRLSCI